MYLLLAFSLLLSGCSYTTYQNGPVKVFRVAIGNDLALSKVTDTVKDGGHSVKIGGYDSNQSEAIKRAVEVAIDTAMKGL